MRLLKESDRSQDNTEANSGIFCTRERTRAQVGAHKSQGHGAAARKATSTKVSQKLITLATAVLVVTLIFASAWIINPHTGSFASATEVTASSLTNNNIGKHPLHALISWDATGENLQNGGRFNWSAAVTGDYVDASEYAKTGVGTKYEEKDSSGKVIRTWYDDEFTPTFIKTAVNSTLNDKGGDTILEQSPTFTYKLKTEEVEGQTYDIYVDSNGNAVYFDKIAQEIALKYGFREGKELVFNINDEGTAARVWSDAVLFTQHIGPAECIPLVSYADFGRYRTDTGLIPDTTMYAFDNGDYVFRTKLTEEEISAGSVVYNAAAATYGVWEKYEEGKLSTYSDDSNGYVKKAGAVQRFSHFFVNDNGSYYYNKDSYTIVTSDSGNVEEYGGHKVKYSLFNSSFESKWKSLTRENNYSESPTPNLLPTGEDGKTLNVHGPVYRGNYFIENGRYEGWGSTGAYGGAKLMGQYITVRLNCDWTAKEIKTNIYTVEGKTTTFDFVKTGEADNAYKTENDAYVKTKDAEEKKYFDKQTSGDTNYTLFYDASSIPFATGSTPFTPYNELCAFSNGRINVPVGSYIVLDLNGHTIDRALSDAKKYDNDAGSSAYQYFGSVFSVNEFARLEVYDSAAFENASDTHISGANKENSAENYGVTGGLTTDHKGTITGGYVTHQYTKDGGNGRKVTEGSASKDIGDSNYNNKLSKLNIDDGVTRDSFTSAIADENQAKGAAIHLFGHSDFVLHSGTIKGNNAASQYGGAVYVLSNASMTMFDGYIINNQAYRIGGGIYLADASAAVLTMYNGVIGYNYGGAGKLTLQNSNDLREDGLKQFRAIENYGGGIALRTKAYCNLYGGSLIGNYSYGPGAGMYIQGTAVGTLAGVTIKDNHTFGAPGGQGGSFAPFGGGGGIFVGGTGARIGFRGALQIVDNYRDNIIENTAPTGKTGDWQGMGGYTTSIRFNEIKTTDNLHLPMQEMTRDTTGHTNPTTNGTDNSGENENGTGDGSPASDNYSVDWNSNATIIISGPLVEKGIVANIGITMQAANAPFNSNLELEFTQYYTSKDESEHNDINPYYFFKADNPAYSIQTTTDPKTNQIEGILKQEAPTADGLTWVVEGHGIDADTKSDATGAPVLSDLRIIVKADGSREYWYKNPNRSASGSFRDTLAKVIDNTNIDSAEVELSNKEKTKDLKKILDDSFVATGGSLDFEYSMLNVTRVAVYSCTPDLSGETLTTSNRLAYWETTGKGDSFGINSTFYTSNFRFKLGEEDLTFDNHNENEAGKSVAKNTRMYEAIKATDESLSYAGQYSFLYKGTGSATTATYSNPTFKINIKQVGVEATRQCYFDGADVITTTKKQIPWVKNEFTWGIGDSNINNTEKNVPYFVYRGGYYYPILSADFNSPINGSALLEQFKTEEEVKKHLVEDIFLADDTEYVRVLNPEKNTNKDAVQYLYVRRDAFNGYVMQFRYSNLYFGTTNDGAKRDVHFGAHDGGGVEYKTMHKKPGSNVAEGQYVDGVMHAGTYLVTFVASSSGSAELGGAGVYYAANNFAFNAEVRLLVESAHAQVSLTTDARNNLVYNGSAYEDRQIVEFDNTSDTKIIPFNDAAVIFRYYLYNNDAIWNTGRAPSLDDLRKDSFGGLLLKPNIVLPSTDENGRPNTDKIPTGLQQPLNARTYIVAVTLELDMDYEEYDYQFDADLVHLVKIDIPEGTQKAKSVWAYWFTIDPAEINPYEDTVAGDGNTSVTITKTVNYNGKSYGYNDTVSEIPDKFDAAKLSEQAILPNITFNGGASSTVLQLGQDYTIEYVDFAETPAAGKHNFKDASVGLLEGGPEFGGYRFGWYNLAIKITFGGENGNYANNTSTEGKADDKGTAYEDADGAFYVYFRIVPVIVTASANISYTYDGGSYDRGRWLDKRKDHPDDAEMYESIFFLVQDSITTPNELIQHQKDATYEMPYPGAPKETRTLDDLWGGVEGFRSGTQTGEHTYDDTTFYKNRYTISDVNVQYTNNEFITNGIRLGVGMYAFQTGDSSYKPASYYHLTTIGFDNENSIDQAPDSKKPGVMWLLTVGNTQTFASTNNDEKTDATNFIINSTSYLNVTINQRNIDSSDVDVKFNNEAYTAESGEKEFPYAGVAYTPPVELSFTASRPSDKSAAERPKDTIKLALYGAAAYDYFTTYNNNTTVSTDTAKAQVILNANKYSASADDKFSNNYYGSRTINFKIVPAKIQATIDGGEHVFTYDGSAKTLKVTYENIENYDETILSPPVPNGAEITTQYKKLVDQSTWGSTPPSDAGTYRVALYSNSANFMFVGTADFELYTAEDVSTGTHRSVRTKENVSDLVINPRKVYIGPSVKSETAEDNPTSHGIVTAFTYNRNLQIPQLKSTNICSVSDATGDWVANFDDVIIPSSSNYTVTYTKAVMPEVSTAYSNRDGYQDAGEYWMILDMVSENFIWGGYNVVDVLFTHETLSDTRLAVQYTIAPSQVLLKPADSISGATYPEGTLHFTYDGTKHEVGVVLSSHDTTPLSTEYQLNAVGFVGEKPTFAEKTEENYMSIYAGTYSFTVAFKDAAVKNNYKWSESQEDWNRYNNAHENSVVIKKSTETNDGNKIVFVDTTTDTVTITYVIDPAKVYISSIDSKLYNREEQDDIAVNFKNEVETNSQVPTKYDISFKVSDKKNQWLYQPYDPSIEGSETTKINARLGDNGKPYYAGNYDATITLSGDDANNFFLVQQKSYKSDRNIEKSSEKTAGNTADYSDKVAGADGKSAVALFVIEALGVYATQTLPSVMFDNKDHFMGDPYGIDADAGRYGGIGPWTISYSSLNGETPVDGISYNIKFENEKYLVVIKMGGYSHGSAVKTLDPDAIYLQRIGEDDIAKKINSTDDDDGIKAAFTQIQALGLFTNADKYSYTLTFEFANFYFAGELGGDELLPKVKPLQFTINPAQIALGTLANKTFNNAEQEPLFGDDSFVPVGDTKFDESIYSILKGYNDTKPGSGFTFSYAAEHGNARLVGGKPFNAGTYNVTVTLHSKNFTFSGNIQESSTTFTIDPFDISELNDEQFVAKLPDVYYTGITMLTYIEQVTIKIGEQSVVLVLRKSSDTDSKLVLGDKGYELTITRYENNINVVRGTDPEKTPQAAAEAYISGSGNFTGEIMRKFKILPREVDVEIKSNVGNIYGVNLCSEMHVPSNLGNVKGVNWKLHEGSSSEMTAGEINKLAKAMVYGSVHKEEIETLIKNLQELQDKHFMYSSDDLQIILSIAEGIYNKKNGAAGEALLVGEYKIAGISHNENYNVNFSGEYTTKTGKEGNDKYGYYEVVQREIFITPADLGIVYGHAIHEYLNNSALDGTQLYWTASFDYGTEAILADDDAHVKQGIKLEIMGMDGHKTGDWLNVGAYKINVKWTPSSSGDDFGNSIRACYDVKGIGSWIGDTAGIALDSVDALEKGNGGTYTVTPRDITVKIKSNVMGYEYNKEEPNETRNILDYMLQKFATDGNITERYERIITVDKGTNINDETNWFAGGEGYASLNLEFIKDEGVGAATYSVTPKWNNNNYNVTFEGASNSVTISPRKIVVHINDQTSIYGDDVIVGTAEGQTANWYAMLAKDSTYWNEELYGGDDKLDDRIAKGCLEDDNLSLIISKEFGANVGKYYLSGTYANSNYDVTFEGSWTAAISTTTEKDGDPTDLTAGIYEIAVRPVTVTILGQSGVYGGNQHISIGATENTHWRADIGTVGSGKGVVNNDSLGINISIVYDDSLNKNKNSGQLNVGWYSLRVSYNNPNYNVTFEGDNSNLDGAQYVKGYDTHNTVEVTSHEGSYDLSNAYYIYARVISITVQPQAFQYNGSAPVLNQGTSWWTANNVINGNLPAILSGDEEDFASAIVLELVEPTEGDSIYEIWKKWGMWSVGVYDNKCGIKATLNDPERKLFENYELVASESSVLGALRITAAEISVMHNGQESTYNKEVPDIVQTSYTIDSEETKVFSSRKWNEAESKFADDVTTDKDKLNFAFTFDGADYGAGRHLILGNWAEPDNANPNYTVKFNAGTYTINKRNLVITIMDQYAIYGEPLWDGVDGWWLDEVGGEHGDKTFNPKYWTIKVTNPNLDYPNGDKIYWVNEADRSNLNIAPVIGAQKGANAGTYLIGGSWNTSNDDYNVTFVGSKGTGGTYTVYQRAITVHINDQGGVYGSFSGGTPVDQSMGSDDKTGGWYVVGFDKDKQQDICGEHACDDPTEPFVLVSDALSISLTLGDALSATDGVYNNHKIVGHCGNDNYAVKFVGGEASGESEYNRGDYGIFGLIKRQVTVNIQNQKIEYGKLANGATTGFGANAYSAVPKNDTINPRAFVESDNVRVVLTVAVKYSADGRGNYNQAGRYAITVRIYETIDEAETLIYSSVASEQGTVTASDKYDLTVEGEYEDTSFKEGYKGGESGNETVHGKTGAYEINKIDLTVTVLDKSSVYGEPVVKWEFNMTGAMTAEESFIRESVSLAIDGENETTWGGKRHNAGTYNISAKLENEIINNNYNVVFRTQYGEEYDEVSAEKKTAKYIVSKRMVSVRILNSSSTYGVDVALANPGYEASPIGVLTGNAILDGDDLEITLSIFGNDKENASYNFSASDNLKAGVYPIVGKWNNNANYDLRFESSWSSTNTNTWREQRDENKLTDAATVGQFVGQAGVYTVLKRNLTVTLGTNNPSSEYGDDIVGFDGQINTENSWGVEYEEQAGDRGLVPDDKIVFNMTTAARKGYDAKDYLINEINVSGGDDANYYFDFKKGTYTIKRRNMEVSLEEIEGAIDVYGTPYVQEENFKYIFYRSGTNKGSESTGLYGLDEITLKITPIEVGVFTKTATGFYPVYEEGYMLNIVADGEKKNNYVFTNMEGYTARYHVTPRPITVFINDQSSVYGEPIEVHNEQGVGSQYGWYVAEGEIVKGNGLTDDLKISIIKQSGSTYQEEGYKLNPSYDNDNYNVTFVGGEESEEGVYARNHGIYMIEKRNILIEIYNQYSIYGEAIYVSSESTGANAAWKALEGDALNYEGNQYYTLLEGETPGIELNIYTLSGGVQRWYNPGDIYTRGEYYIGVQNVNNNNYEVTIKANKLYEEDRSELIDKFNQDFGKTTTKDNIEVKNPVISAELANSANAIYFVTIRPVNITINNQSGTYGDYIELLQGEHNAYTVDLGKYKGAVVTTGSPFVYGYNATFDLVTTAFYGSDTSGAHPVGKSAGWSLDAETYPIFGSSYTAYFNGVAGEEAENLSYNYQFNFEGSYLGEETYPTGTTFYQRAGVFTVNKRQISLTALGASATYGGDDANKFVAVPEPNQMNYQAVVGNSNRVKHDGISRNPIVSDNDRSALNIRLVLEYEEGQLSSSKALKVGTYTIRLEYDENNNYDITEVNNGTFAVTVRQASILINQSAAKATYLAAINSPWAVKAIGDYAAMYQLSNVLSADVIAFTMTTSAVAGNPVGLYPLNGSLDKAAEGNDNGNYSITFTSGTFEITKKSVDVTILDQSSEYGENITLASSLWKLPEDWNRDGDFTNNDDPAQLGIKLSTLANNRTDVGVYQIYGQYNANGEVGKNYDLHFVGSWNSSDAERTNGNGGTLTITQRSIVIVLLPQTSVYRDDYAINQYAWYAWRGGKTAVWKFKDGEYVFEGKENRVLGPKDDLSSLNVSLSKGAATDIETYGPNTNGGTYVGTYEIIGRFTASNYNVIFANEDPNSKENFDYSTITENQKGEYTITPYEITINILNLGMEPDLVRYGDSAYTKDGNGLFFGAEIVSTQGVVWDYKDSSKQFMPADVAYLSFYLGGSLTNEDGSDVYAFVGNHPIVGVWGLGLTNKNASDYRMRFNYDVKFEGEWGEEYNSPAPELGYGALYKNEGATAYGSCGVMKISNAKVLQAQYDQSVEDGEANGSRWNGDNWARKAMFSGDDSHSMAVGEKDLIFAGAVKFDGYESSTFGSYNNTALQQAVKVTYSDLQQNGSSRDIASDAPLVGDVGIWTVKVTIEAPYHDEITFELTLTIDRLEITVYLNGTPMNFPYGQYRFNGTAVDDGDALNTVLKNMLFGNSSATNKYLDFKRDGGAITGADDLGSVDEIMEYLFNAKELTVSISTRKSDSSTGGYLNAGTYSLTISAGVNMVVNFADDYDNVVVEKHQLKVDWTPTEGNMLDEHKDGNPIYKYTFSNKDIEAVPYVLSSSILPGDKLLEDDNYSKPVFTFEIYNMKDGGEKRLAGARNVVNVGLYKMKIVQNISPTEKNADIGNYITPEGWVYVQIDPKELTIIVENQSWEYDGTTPAIDQSMSTKEQPGGWYIKSDNSADNVTGGNHPTLVPGTGEDPSTLGVVLFFGEKDKNATAAGSYEIKFSSLNTNYKITFEGAFDAPTRLEGHGGIFEITRRKVLVQVQNFTFTYGDLIPDNLADDANSYKTIHLVNGEERPGEIAVLPSDTINLKFALEGRKDKLTSTGYVKAGSYDVLVNAHNDNYAITFADSEGNRQGMPSYNVNATVDKKDLAVSIHGRQLSYGDPRPAMPENYDITGLALNDKKHYEGNRPDFINFIIRNAANGEILKDFDDSVEEEFRFDKVGVYIIIGSVVEDAEGIGMNYEVEFKGEWEDYGIYTGDEYFRKAGKYKVGQRKISIQIIETSSEYGDIEKIDFELLPGENNKLAPGDNKTSLLVTFKTDAIVNVNGERRTNNVGKYLITDPVAGNTNYEIASYTPEIYYTVMPRKVTVAVRDASKNYGDPDDPNEYLNAKLDELLTFSRTTQGKVGNAILQKGDVEFEIRVIDGEDAKLTDGRPYYVGVYNYELKCTKNIANNYDITFKYDGHYKILPKPITVTIDSRTTRYSEDIPALTYKVEGLVGNDDLKVALSILWGDEALNLEYHNVGVYRIKGAWDNPNYAVTFRGEYENDNRYGAYRIEKAINKFTKEYDGNGTVYMGDNYRDGDLPTALWGNDSVHYEYYLDEARTQRADFDDISDAPDGVYYVKAVADEALNWTDAVTTFVIRVYNSLGFSDGLDITAYVCIYISQFIILTCALIFIKRKKEKNKIITKAGN